MGQLSTGINSLIDQNAQFENDMYGVYLYSNSSVAISNTEFCSNDYDIYNTVNIYYVDASDASNSFSRNPAPVYGLVTLPSGGYSYCGMPKSSALNSKTIKNNSTSIPGLHQEKALQDDPAYKEFVNLTESYFSLTKEVKNDTKANGKFNKDKFAGRYGNLIDSIKTFINNNPNSELSKTMLATAVGCYKKLDDYSSMKNLLDKISSDKSLSLLSGFSKRFMIDYFNNQKDYTNSLSLADEIIKGHQEDKDLLCDVQLEKGLIYEYSLSNNNDAIKCYNNILSDYPDNKLATIAKHHLEKLGVEIKKGVANSQDNKNIINSISNYPNPFNPATTIYFTLRQKDYVTLIVYDILGKEVIRLIDGIQTEGEHSVSFDGSSLASGMYIYQLKGSNFNISKKMLLLK